MKTTKYTKIASLMLGGTLLLGAVGCTDKFEDFNTNPKFPTPEEMEGDFSYTATLIGNMVPLVAVDHENDYQMMDQMVGCEFGRMTTASNNWGSDGMFGTYNPRIGWQGSVFNTLMPKYMYTPFFQIRDASKGEGLVYHWAQILRIFGTVRISDCYGPTPYSMIGTGSSYSVAYDDMPDLYNAMFADLDAAIEALRAAPGVNNAFVNTDYVYHGDMSKWLKFANTLKLRMALRIVNPNPALAKQKAEEAVADLGGLISEPADAAWSDHLPGGNALHKVSVIWEEGAVSADITSYMNGYADPRLPAYVKPASNGEYLGARNGVWHYTFGFKVSSENPVYYSKSIYESNSKMLSISASESWFLRAEGALRGWNMGGTAQELYEQGVRTSMSERGVQIGNYLESTATPGGYTVLSGDNAAYNIAAQTDVTPKWDASATFEKNLERIIVQKWLGNFPNGWESWADFRRTGYPKWFPVVDNLSTDGVTKAGGMRRIPFPQGEFNTNEANVRKAIQMLGGPDNSATNLWWAKK